MKLLFIRSFLLSVMVWLLPVFSSAQQTVLSKSFSNFNPSDFSEWEFVNCTTQSTGNKYMQVGTTSLGEVVTPALGISGNANLLIKTSRQVSSTSAGFRISVLGDGTVSPTEYVIGSGSEYRPSAILLKGLSPSSKIKIEGTSGCFLVMTMKVFAFDEAVFYESFDYMNGRTNEYEFYTSNTEATSALCDNSTNISMAGIKSSYKCVYLENRNSEYKILSAPVDDNSNVILSFQIGYPSITNYQKLTLSCSDDAQITQLNSTNQNTLFTSVEKTQFSESRLNWHEYFVIVHGMSSSTILTFKATDICLNNVMLSPIPLGLDQSSSNVNYIKANDGQVRNVQLIRTLTPNTWCPLCLPFDITQSQMDVAAGTTCELCTLTDIRDGVFIFDKASSVSAGTPFLVKVDKQVENPVFTGVMVVNTPAATVTGTASGYSFVGTYSPVTLNTNGTHLFLDKEGNLCQPGSEEGHNRLNGLRAYFVVPEPSEARVFISDTSAEVSRISNTSTARHNTYDLYGRQIDASYSKGLQIRNGRKFLIP